MLVELDYMENYITDALAQAAYVSSTPSVPSEEEIDYFERATDCLMQAAYLTNGHHAMTFVATAQLDTAFKKWCTASLLLDGGSDYIWAADSPDWDICASNSDDKTISLWVRHTDHVDEETYVMQYEGNADYWSFAHSHGLGIRFYFNLGGSGVVATPYGGEITDSDWHHIALCKVADKYGIYVDGTQVVYLQDNSEGTLAGTLEIGAHGTRGVNWFQGHIDDLAIIHSNIFGANPQPGPGFGDTIIPPIAPLQTDTNTKILLHFDGADGAVATPDWSRLESRSEAVVIQQGTYSLEGFAKAADSINDFLMRTVSPTIDLSGIDTLYFYIYSNRTGSNIKVGIHDGGGVTTEITPNILVANTWQLVTWDISGVADADKNDIDSIIITIIIAAADNTFYIDNFYSISVTVGLLAYSEDTILQQGSYSLKILAPIGTVNDTLTHTFATPLDLSDKGSITMAIWASRIGSNFRFTLVNSNGATFSYTPYISAADGWKDYYWDISGVPNADKNAITTLIITIVNDVAQNTIYLDVFFVSAVVKVETPGAIFLSEQANRSNTPGKEIELFINGTPYELTEKFLSMNEIDREMTYKPGQTNQLTISDQVLTMTNADRYFSDMEPTSIFYDRDYAGQDVVKVWAGFKRPDGYIEVMQKAWMKLMYIELDSKNGIANLGCEDWFRSIFDIYVGMPDETTGNPDPLLYPADTFKEIVDDLLQTHGGVSPVLCDIENVDPGQDYDITWTKKTIRECIQEISVCARGSTIVRGNGMIEFRKFISEDVVVDYILNYGVNFSQLRYVGQHWKYKIQKVVIIGPDAARYKKAEIAGDIGITLKVENDLIPHANVAADMAAEMLGRFAVRPALVEVWAEYLPSLEIKDVMKIYEPNTMSNPLIMQIRKLRLNIVDYKMYMLLSIPDSGGRQKTWTSKADFEEGVLTDIEVPPGLDEVQLKSGKLSGNGIWIFNAERVVNWIFFDTSEEGWGPATTWVEKAPQLGVESAIRSLAILDGKLYGGTGNNGKLYEWNGANAWVEKAPKLGDETHILSLAVLDGKLYGGTYPNGKLYEWNGANAWVEKAPKLGDETRIYSLAEFNGKLYGGTALQGKLYEWNGTDAWVEVAPQLGEEVSIWSLIEFDSKLYGGTYSSGKLYEWKSSPSITYQFWKSADGVAWGDPYDNIADVLNSQYIRIKVSFSRYHLIGGIALEDMTVGYFLTG